MTHYLLAQFVALPHDGADHRFGAVSTIALVLDGFVQHRVEVFAFLAERCQAEPGQRAHQLVGYRLQRARLQVAVLACSIEIVQHAQQFIDDGGLGPIRCGLLVAQRPFAVVGEIGLNPLQISGQLSDFGVRLIGLTGGR